MKSNQWTEEFRDKTTKECQNLVPQYLRKIQKKIVENEKYGLLLLTADVRVNGIV